MDHVILSTNQQLKPIMTCTYALHVFARSTTFVRFDVCLDYLRVLSFAYCKHFIDSGFGHPIQLDSKMV